MQPWPSLFHKAADTDTAESLMSQKIAKYTECAEAARSVIRQHIKMKNLAEAVILKHTQMAQLQKAIHAHHAQVACAVKAAIYQQTINAAKRAR